MDCNKGIYRYLCFLFQQNAGKHMGRVLCESSAAWEAISAFFKMLLIKTREHNREQTACCFTHTSIRTGAVNQLKQYNQINYDILIN